MTMKGALVGYGFIAERGHLPAYVSSGMSVVAIADQCEERRAAAKARFPEARVYSNHQDLLLLERDLDFVDITTPPYAHAKIASDVLSRGVHVLCEKPIVTDVADARKLLELATRERRVFFPSHNYLHAPVVKAVRSVLDEKIIGDVHLCTLQTFRSTHAKGVSEWRPDWRREKDFSGGGIAMDHGSHTFYLAFEWMRSYPHSVAANMSTSSGTDTEDDFSCTLEFPSGVVHTHLTWRAGFRKVIYTLHGSDGAIRVEDDCMEVSRKKIASNGSQTWDVSSQAISSRWMDASHVEWFGSLFRDFQQAVKNCDYVGKQAKDGLFCIDLISTAYASAREGSRKLKLRNA